MTCQVNQSAVCLPHTCPLAVTFSGKYTIILFAVNGVAILALYNRQPREFVLASVLLALAGVFGWRSSVFYGHMGQAVYGHYLVAVERRASETPPEDNDD